MIYCIKSCLLALRSLLSLLPMPRACTDSFEAENERIYFDGLECAW